MLYAKRHYEGIELVEETLIEHIQSCLEVYTKMMQLLPQCPYDISFSQLTWEEIGFLLVAFHDMGKSADKFQTITLNLSVKESWGFRHEVLSVEFIDLLEIDEGTKTVLKLAILGHHEKNISELQKNICYNNENMYGLFGDQGDKKREKQYLEAKESLKETWEQSKQVLSWIAEEFHTKFDKKMPIRYEFEKMQSICSLIDDYQVAISEDETCFRYDLVRILKGILITCDHLGSGHNTIEKIEQDIYEWYIEKFRIGSEKNDFRSTQKESNTMEDTLLIAPTGTGKTEAAFIWANNFLKVNPYRRVFYVLPYTASITGMYRRLQKEPFGFNKVDMKHGKSQYAYYQQLLASQSKDKDVTREIKREIQVKAKILRQLSKEISHPIKIVTPHQIIKAFYKVKGYETLLTEFHDALFILDEIHCYDAELTCVLIIVLKYIKYNLGGKLFLMSATFPKALRHMILEQLGISNEIVMQPQELEKFVRHELHVQEGSIEEQEKNIKHDLHNGKRVLIVCNTIKKAQYMYEQLKDYAESSLLLHSYFAVKDRGNIEETLLKGENEEDGCEPIQLLVGTQAIEVSLDLDFDTIYTELAPIDALLQRFGRVYRNRKRNKGEYGKVFVCTSVDKGSDYIYNRPIKLLELTLEKLRIYDGMPLTDDILQDMLEYVYAEEYKNNLLDIFQKQAKKFKDIQFYPLQDYSQVAQTYFEQFDGLKLCPEIYLEEYQELIRDGLYIEADGYLITVSGRKIYQYFAERKINWVSINPKHKMLIAHRDYFEYDEEKGLQEKNVRREEGFFVE